MKYEFISNTNLENNGNLYKYIEKGFEKAKSFCFSVAFINFAGVQIILDILKKSEKHNIKGKILTTNYLHFTELKSIEFLKRFKNIEVKFFDSDKMEGFHTKGYIFEYDDYYKAIIGSSNLTKSGLKSNIEWNAAVTTEKNSDFIKGVLNEFNYLWEKGVENVNPYIVSYVKKEEIVVRKKVRDEYFLAAEDHDFGIYKESDIKPNYMQEIALKNLETTRMYGETRALCIAATGTGKTYLGAFDVKAFKAKKMLFIVHNEDILKSAMETFKNILPEKTMGFFTGNIKNVDRDYIFATIQSLNNRYQEFNEYEFDYIIVDEAHHITAKSYEKVINYFKPKFLLGLTATPERCDGGNIYEIFHMNVPVEIRLQEALDRELVTPFHYYGVKDISDVNLEGIDLNDIAAVTKALNLEKRVDFIIEKMNFYGYSGERRKTIGFCVSIEHCEYMTKEFLKKGVKAATITGNHGKDLREDIIKKFKETEELEVIFTVNIFNEGIDIPCINSILMLRPTASPIIFTQQLGRGLRHYENKEFLTVIDFIGNHSRAFLIALALMGRKGYDKESIKIAVKRDFDNLSKSIHVKMEEICKKEILKQLDNENFNSLKYLKAEYDEFKDYLKGKIPRPLDFVEYEDAPNFYKYVRLQKSYLDFLAKVKDNLFSLNEKERVVIREIERFLPIKRVYEFAIIHELIAKDQGLPKDKVFGAIGKYIEISDINHTIATIDHAMRYLNGDYYDSQDLKRCGKLFQVSDGTIEKTELLNEVLKNKDIKDYILEVLDYGLLKYKESFGTEDYGFPFLKLYENYFMKDVALICNYQMKHSSVRGTGLFTNGNNYFLFVDLHKGADIKESIKYNDKILDRYHFQWESPNTTRVESERGQNIVKNRERGISLHIFVRKYKEVDGVVQPYIYIGKGDCVDYRNEKPITTTLKLENPLSKEIYIELTERVEKVLQVAEAGEEKRELI
ncbi:MAG: DEAD/DEAH box helicase [Cetobacterium sp.]|uniref:DEAD/DEAH box helicase n=1 Tax=Cetobacterium sp. TaxID=2071632 RepID=UPI003F2AEA87